MARLILYQGFRIQSEPYLNDLNENHHFRVSGHIYIDQACKAEFIYHLENIPPEKICQDSISNADDIFIKYARLWIDQRLGNWTVKR